MASPSTRATTYLKETSDTTTHDVDMSGVQAGDRALLFAIVDNEGTAPTLSGFPAGWSQLSRNTGTGAGVTTEIWEKVDCTGTELSFTYTSSSAQKSKNRLFFIQDSDTTTAAEVGTWASGALSEPDPPSLSPSWGADDTQWWAFYAVGEERGDAEGYPANYTSDQYTDNTGVSDNTAPNYGVASRQLNAASENPGTFTADFGDPWRANTVAIPPAAASTQAIGRADEADTAQSISSFMGTVFPAAPTGLGAVATSPDTVVLDWNPVAGVTGYDIERTNEATSVTQVIQQNWDDIQYTDFGLTANTGYTYRVRGVVQAITEIGLASEVSIALPVTVGETAEDLVNIGQALEFDFAQPVLVASGGGFGAGVPGAALPVPPGAITATPGTLANLINANSGGSTFELISGTYPGNYPNKAGNRYYGDPNNHGAVIFDGQVTYDGSGNVTGGTSQVMTVQDNNVFANFTVRKYATPSQRGPWNWGSGVSNVLMQNIEAIDNRKIGFRPVGSDNTLRFCTSRFQGQFGYSGQGDRLLVENCLMEKCGDDNMVARGVTPLHTTADRGGSKFVFTNDLIVRNSEWRHLAGADHQGLWADIDNTNVLFENNLIWDIYRIPIHQELGHSATIRGNTIIDSGNWDSSLEWLGGVIHHNAGGVMIVEDNVIDNTNVPGANGIILVQYDRTGTDLGDPSTWSGACGSIIRNNIIRGTFTNSIMSLECTFTKNGCHFVNNPAAVTIQNNDVANASASNPYWQNGEISAPQWAALGYS